MTIPGGLHLTFLPTAVGYIFEPEVSKMTFEALHDSMSIQLPSKQGEKGASIFRLGIYVYAVWKPFFFLLARLPGLRQT